MTTEKRPYQILLAEDSAADVGIVRIALQDQDLDHVLHVVTDGEQAMEFIGKASNCTTPGPDLLLLDMHLPRYDGEEVLERLRSTERYAQTPVIVMTSSDAPVGHAMSHGHAPLFYFRKPSHFNEFIQLGVMVRDILTREKLGGSEPAKGRDKA